MEKPSSASNSGDTTPYHSVFIDTGLDTHFATIVSSFDTVSDLKQKIMHEHLLCFPQFGEIKIHALKVKRRGFYYHLSDSMLVKSAFYGVKKSWFVSVDASSAKQHDDNQHCLNFHSNTMVACIGMNSNGSSGGFKLLPDAYPEKLSNDVDKQLLDRKAVVADNLGLDVTGGEVVKNLEIGFEHIDDNNGTAKSVDINNRLDFHTQEKREECDNENEKTPAGGWESSSKTGIDDVQVSLMPESILETGSPAKKKRKGRKRCQLDLPDRTSEEANASLPGSGKNESQQETVVSQSFLENAIGVVSQDKVTENENMPRMVSYSEANKVTDSVMPSATVLNGGTGMLEKPDERKNDKSRKTDADVQCSKSVEDTSQSKSVAKKKRKFQEGKKGDEGLLKDDQTWISDSNKRGLETPTISQHSLVGKLKNVDGILDGSCADTTEVVHLHSVDPTNDKGRKKKKSSSTLNQEIAPAPSGALVAKENCGDPKDLGEEFDVIQGKPSRAVISSGSGVVSLKEEHGNSFQEANIRPSFQEFDISNREVCNVEGRHSETVDASKSSKKRKKSKKRKALVSVKEDNCGDPKDLGEKFDAELIHGKSMQGVVSSDPVVISLKEKHGNPLQEANIRPPSSQEFDISNREASNVEGRHSEIVGLSKSSKKRKKSKKTKDLVNGTLSSPTIEPHKAASGDHFDNNVNKQESNIPPNDRKEASERDTISTSFLATDKEIDDVIQNVVESVQRIGKGEVDSENMNVKSRKRTGENRSSDVKNFTESKKASENVGDKPAPSANNIGEVAKVMKQAKLTNADSIIRLNGSTLEGEKGSRVENDTLSTRSSQFIPHRLETNSEERCLKAVVNGNPAESGHANEATNDKEVSCESNRINFNNYFVPSQHCHDVGSAEVLVDRVTETKTSDGKTKTRKSKKKSPGLQSSQRLNENQGVGAMPQADNSSTRELQSSLLNSKSENITRQPKTEPLNASDTVVKALPPGMPDKSNNVNDEARSHAVKPSGTNSHAKSKRAASNSSLESHKNTILLNTRVKEPQSREDQNPMGGKKSSTINTAEVVNNSQHKKSLIGVSGSIFKVDSAEASSNEADSSDASTRTPSDNSFSSDYSDGESNADFNSSQNGHHSWKRKKGGGKAYSKPFSSGMSLDTILRSSSRYKKAKLTASQSQLEDLESQPVDFVPDSQANT